MLNEKYRVFFRVKIYGIVVVVKYFENNKFSCWKFSSSIHVSNVCHMRVPDVYCLSFFNLSFIEKKKKKKSKNWLKPRKIFNSIVIRIWMKLSFEWQQKESINCSFFHVFIRNYWDACHVSHGIQYIMKSLILKKKKKKKDRVTLCTFHLCSTTWW